MLLIYRILINLIFILSPLILIIRLLNKKKISKDLKRNSASFQKKENTEKLFGFMEQVSVNYKVLFHY